MNSSTYNITKNNVPVHELLEILHPHMFSLKALTHAHQHKLPRTLTLGDTDNSLISDWDKTLKNDQHSHEKGSEMFFPKERDQLFWCYYILVNGFSAYEMIDTHRFTVEKNEKLKCVELIRLHRKHLTANKVRGIDTIENMLVHDHTIDVKAFIALCVVSNLNVLFVHRRKVYRVLLDVDNMEPENVHVIHQYDSPRMRYGYETGTVLSKMNEYLCRTPEDNTTPYYVNAVSLTNPLRAISSYKVGELRDMVIKLKILDVETAWKKTKPQMYETIARNL
jgi:hypothetical protein